MKQNADIILNKKFFTIRNIRIGEDWVKMEMGEECGKDKLGYFEMPERISTGVNDDGTLAVVCETPVGTMLVDVELSDEIMINLIEKRNNRKERKWFVGEL